MSFRQYSGRLLYFILFDGLPNICLPTIAKTFERIDLSPNSMNALCSQCGKDVRDSDKRRRLFSGPSLERSLGGGGGGEYSYFRVMPY